MQGYETTWPVFLAIIALYVAISLIIGGRKAYFEPFKDKPDAPEDKETSQTPTSHGS